MAQHTKPTDVSTGETPIALSRLVLMAGMAVLLGVGVVGILEQGMEQPIPATLLTEGARIVAGRQGRVAEVLVQPGASVKPGDVLIRLADERLMLRISAKEREVRELSAEKDRIQAAAEMELEWRRRDLNAEIFQTELKAASCLEQKLTREVEQIAWKERLSAGAFLEATPADLIRPLTLNDDSRFDALLKEDAAAAAVETLETQHRLCERRLEELRALEKSLVDRVRLSAGVSLAETRLADARRELGLLEEQAKGLDICSACYGQVGTTVPDVGDPVQPGQILVELLDQDQPYLLARVPSRLLSRFSAGTELTVVFSGEGIRRGEVRSIPLQAVPGSAVHLSDAYIDVQIVPKGRLWPRLPIGSRANVEMRHDAEKAGKAG